MYIYFNMENHLYIAGFYSVLEMKWWFTKLSDLITESMFLKMNIQAKGKVLKYSHSTGVSLPKLSFKMC